ncbi:MAG: Tetratricopeptide 2 repeat protein [Pedosphaera sp.]|nr:Tetratricopeptide 2 repeat protein [Pedosphaera sp.]
MFCPLVGAEFFTKSVKFARSPFNPHFWLASPRPQWYMMRRLQILFMRRGFVFLCCCLLALTVRGATPELGKDALRKLVRLPSIAFEATWAFDPERGFSVGSNEAKVLAKIADLRQQMKHDPGDAENYLQIAELYSSLNDSANARKTYSRAADFFRKRLELQPDDGLLLTGLGPALDGSGKTQEAESVLRQAVRLAPKEWKCRVALGRFLDAQARRDTASDKVLLAQRELAEAGECFDRAASLAPETGEIYFRRGMHRSLRAMLLNQIRVAEGEQPNDVLLDDNQFSEAALADLQRASRLQSGDHALIGSVVLFEIYTVNARHGRMNWADFSWSSLPEKSQRSIRDAVTRLENLAQDSDPQQAAGALEVLGILQGPILHEPRNCIAHLRRALALDPAREQAWEVLAATLAQSERYDDLLTACEDRVKQKESARSHLMLAKAFEKSKLWDESESEILEALRMAPNNFTATLSEAALVLRRSQDDGQLPEANSWLARSERLLSETPAVQRNTQLIVDLTLTRSIYFALNDEVESARQWAKAVLNQDKNNKRAHEILAAMDY